ncbi:MAG: hypothetical protein V1645_00240 [archaeon]
MSVDDLMRRLDSGSRGTLFHDSVRDLLVDLGLNFNSLRYDVRIGKRTLSSFSSSDDLVSYVRKNDVDSIMRCDNFGNGSNGAVVVSTTYDSPFAFRQDRYKSRFIRSNSKLGLTNKILTPADAQKLYRGSKKPLSYALDMGFVIRHGGFYFMHPMSLYGLVLKKKEKIT